MKNLGQHLGQSAKNLFFQSGEPTGKIDRIISIDAFRGLAIALMIVGDNPGNVQRFYPQLRHAEWNGITLVDFAFPLFVFIAGLVVPYAISKRLSRGDSVYQIIGYICSRSIGLFLIGLFLNGFPLYDLSSLRIMGVLQRIAIAYFVAGTITLLVEDHKNLKTSLTLSLPPLIFIWEGGLACLRWVCRIFHLIMMLLLKELKGKFLQKSYFAGTYLLNFISQ